MQILPKKSAQKKTILIGVAAFIIVALAAALAYHYQLGPFHSANDSSSINLAPPTSDQKAAGDKIKQGSLENGESKQNTTGSDQPPAPTPQPGSSKSEVEIMITAANQNDSVLQIRSLISTVTDNGTCTLKLTGPANQSLTRTAEVQALSTTSTCKGFDIQTSELAPGDWKATLEYDSNTLTGSTSKTITIKA